ncbi:Flp family type IVb pilin [Alienimonas sp. DA493]|uniref:Flp family type IVb pilin n=1 Tax=Alienimonas sp. DA493 TaxID=3373605 RepID=UPI0037551726
MTAARSPRSSAQAFPRRRTAARTAIRRFLTTEDGPTSVEYAVMLALILASIFGTIGAVGGTTGGLFARSESQLDAVGF